MANKQNLKFTKNDVFAFGVATLVLLTFYLNSFYNLEKILLFLSLLLGGLLGAAIVLKYKQALLFALSFFVPLSVSVKLNGFEISMPSELICVLLSFFFITKIITGTKIPKSFLKHPITVIAIVDLCWLFVTSCTSELPLVSFKRLTIKLLYYISFYYFYYELFSLDTKNIKRVFTLHCVGLLIPILYTTFHHFAFKFSVMGTQQASKPFYNDHTMYGAILVFFIPFLFISIFSNRSLKVLYTILLLVYICAAYLSYSRAAWLALMFSGIVGCFIYLKIHAKYLFAILLITISIVFLNREAISDSFSRNKELSHSNDITKHFKSISNVNSDASNMERINRWKCALRMFKDKPMFGFGPGTYQFFYGKYQVRQDLTRISTFNGTKGHAHSEYLNYLSETGLIGLTIFLLGTAFVVTTALKVYKKTNDKQIKNMALYLLLGLITFYIHGFFNGFIEFDKLAMPVFSSMAAIVYLDNLT